MFSEVHPIIVNSLLMFSLPLGTAYSTDNENFINLREVIAYNLYSRKNTSQHFLGNNTTYILSPFLTLHLLHTLSLIVQKIPIFTIKFFS